MQRGGAFVTRRAEKPGGRLGHPNGGDDEVLGGGELVAEDPNVGGRDGKYDEVDGKKATRSHYQRWPAHAALIETYLLAMRTSAMHIIP